MFYLLNKNTIRKNLKNKNLIKQEKLVIITQKFSKT